MIGELVLYFISERRNIKRETSRRPDQGESNVDTEGKYRPAWVPGCQTKVVVAFGHSLNKLRRPLKLASHQMATGKSTGYGNCAQRVSIGLFILSFHTVPWVLNL